MSDVTTIEADVPERYADAVSTRLRRAADEDVVGRIWRRTGRCGRLRAPPRSPTGSAGWTSPSASASSSARLRGVRRGPARPRATATRSCSGMGGSSLAPEVFRQSFGKLEPGLTLHVLDSTHPEQVREVLNSIDLDRALMIVSSKSGGTIEPMSMFKAFCARQGDGSHFVAVTDPGSLARGAGGPSTASARSSTATRTSAGATARSRPFGLVPAAAAGIDVAAVLDSAIGAAEECRGEQRQRRPVARLRARRARPARAATSSRSSPTRR